MSEINVVSFGGRVQSTALLVLASQMKEKPLFVFSNVGDDSESPATLDYMRDYAVPFAEEFGIEIVTLTGKTGLYQYAVESKNSIPLPVWLNSGAYGRRTCTTDFKIRRIDRYLKKHYAGQYVNVSLGISWDEMSRMRPHLMEWTDKEGKSRLGFWKRISYPLIDARLNRDDCKRLVQNAGLPIPPKSSCFFCPFKKISEWIDMKHDQPELYEKAIRLESALREKRQRVGKDDIRLTPKGLLEDVTAQSRMFDADDFESCDTGYCHS